MALHRPAHVLIPGPHPRRHQPHGGRRGDVAYRLRRLHWVRGAGFAVSKPTHSVWEFSRNGDRVDIAVIDTYPAPSSVNWLAAYMPPVTLPARVPTTIPPDAVEFQFSVPASKQQPQPTATEVLNALRGATTGSARIGVTARVGVAPPLGPFSAPSSLLIGTRAVKAAPLLTPLLAATGTPCPVSRTELPQWAEFTNWTGNAMHASPARVSMVHLPDGSALGETLYGAFPELVTIDRLRGALAVTNYPVPGAPELMQPYWVPAEAAAQSFVSLRLCCSNQIVGWSIIYPHVALATGHFAPLPNWRRTRIWDAYLRPVHVSRRTATFALRVLAGTSALDYALTAKHTTHGWMVSGVD